MPAIKLSTVPGGGGWWVKLRVAVRVAFRATLGVMLTVKLRLARWVTLRVTHRL